MFWDVPAGVWSLSVFSYPSSTVVHFLLSFWRTSVVRNCRESTCCLPFGSSEFNLSYLTWIDRPWFWSPWRVSDSWILSGVKPSDWSFSMFSTTTLVCLLIKLGKDKRLLTVILLSLFFYSGLIFSGESLWIEPKLRRTASDESLDKVKGSSSNDSTVIMVGTDTNPDSVFTMDPNLLNMVWLLLFPIILAVIKFILYF